MTVSSNQHTQQWPDKPSCSTGENQPGGLRDSTKAKRCHTAANTSLLKPCGCLLNTPGIHLCLECYNTKQQITNQLNMHSQHKAAKHYSSTCTVSNNSRDSSNMSIEAATITTILQAGKHSCVRRLAPPLSPDLERSYGRGSCCYTWLLLLSSSVHQRLDFSQLGIGPFQDVIFCDGQLTALLLAAATDAEAPSTCCCCSCRRLSSCCPCDARPLPCCCCSCYSQWISSRMTRFLQHRLPLWGAEIAAAALAICCICMDALQQLHGVIAHQLIYQGQYDLPATQHHISGSHTHQGEPELLLQAGKDIMHHILQPSTAKKLC